MAAMLATLGTAGLVGAAGQAVGAGVNAVGKALAGDPLAQQKQNAQQQIEGAEASVGDAGTQQQNLIKQFAAQNGIQNQSNVYNQQQALAQQLQDAANGGGPNPALLQLQQTTNQNTANAAGSVASQRGLNAATAARMIGQNTASANQQAAGQGALMAAQQQIAARGQLQNQQGMLANLAGNQVGQQANAISNLNQFALQNKGQAIQQQAGLNAGTQATQQQQDAFQNKIATGITSGLGTAMVAGATPSTASPAMSTIGTGADGGYNQATIDQRDSMGHAKGGMILPQYAEGGQVANSSNQGATLKENYSKKKSGKSFMQHLYAGGTVNMEVGGNVPGTPKVPGARDSYANDTVPAKLSPGEIVLPRSVTQSKDPVKAASAFVAAIMARRGK